MNVFLCDECQKQQKTPVLTLVLNEMYQNSMSYPPEMNKHFCSHVCLESWVYKKNAHKKAAINADH